jgi:anti-anti-sigma regulatory factor
MLKITTTETEQRQTLILCGQLAGPWVAELESAWDKTPQVVDLTEVTFVDEAGARLLCSMKEAGVRFIARGVDTQHLLDELQRKTAPPLRRCLAWLASDPCRKDKNR